MNIYVTLLFSKQYIVVPHSLQKLLFSFIKQSYRPLTANSAMSMRNIRPDFVLLWYIMLTDPSVCMMQWLQIYMYIWTISSTCILYFIQLVWIVLLENCILLRDLRFSWRWRPKSPSSGWRWRQQGSPKRWYHNPEDATWIIQCCLELPRDGRKIYFPLHYKIE